VQEGFFDGYPGLKPNDVFCWLGPYVNEISQNRSHQYNTRQLSPPPLTLSEKYSCEFVLIDTMCKGYSIPHYPEMPSQRYQIYLEMMVVVFNPLSTLRQRTRSTLYVPFESGNCIASKPLIGPIEAFASYSRTSTDYVPLPDTYSNRHAGNYFFLIFPYQHNN
jgi:hypothetical protein